MTIRASSTTPLPNALRLSTVATSTRQAQRTDFGQALKSGFVRAGRAAEQGLRVASPLLPVGGVISAALAGSTAAASEVDVASSSRGLLGEGTALTGPTTASSSFGEVMDATTRMTELNAAFNLRYLQLQQRIQSDTRQFNLVSNVLKTKHDAAKNALANIR
jgi:hypothetical protein